MRKRLYVYSWAEYDLGFIGVESILIGCSVLMITNLNDKMIRKLEQVDQTGLQTGL